MIRLAKNENALVLEFIEMSAALIRHEIVLCNDANHRNLATDEHGFTQIHARPFRLFLS